MSSEILDIGCGTRKVDPSAVGMDRAAAPGVDVVWDLDQYPWPLAADLFSRIHMSHVIEHVADAMRLLFGSTRHVIEGAGAAGVAAMLREKPRNSGLSQGGRGRK